MGANLNSDLTAIAGPNTQNLTTMGRIADLGVLKNFGATTGSGTGTYTPSGATASGAFDPIAAMFGGAAQGALNQGLPAGLQDFLASGGTTDQSNQANSLASMFGGQLQNYNIDDAAAGFTQKLNAIALPGEQQAANSLADRLFSRGRLGGGDTGAGAAFGELSKAQSAAQDARSLQAYGLAGQEADRLASFTSTFGNLGSTLNAANIQKYGNLFSLPGQFQAQNINNAAGAIAGGNAALQPGQQAFNNLFTGAQFSGAESQHLSDFLGQVRAANKASGSGPNAFTSAITGLIGGFGQGGGQALGSAAGKALF